MLSREYQVVLPPRATPRHAPLLADSEDPSALKGAIVALEAELAAERAATVERAAAAQAASPHVYTARALHTHCTRTAHALRNTR